MYDEFPHAVRFQSVQRVPDGGGGFTNTFVPYTTIYGFLDTPTSNERYQAHQLSNPLDRYLYYPYRNDITSAMRVVCEGEVYELGGKPEDQGGQHEIMRVALKLVQNG
ncbi:phage head closure protein [Jeotgalibacillus soli]|uniref:Phage head-tail adapter protein n=1 Tax=Jeotgalibacillus soli TaxID=889306 RepID=A0A0C2R676_9BACL|nr:phage head closure protein [Jeotgalibacillus soli]KIL45760.1 hypothetical protein KP78_21090 [Jeotgalibacillus soli]